MTVCHFGQRRLGAPGTMWLQLGTLGRKTGWDEDWEARRSLNQLRKFLTTYDSTTLVISPVDCAP
jgi:hypothetical protein